MNQEGFRLTMAGDSVVIVELEERIDDRINAHAIGIAATIEAAALSGIRDVVPTYRSIAVYFDPLRTDYAALVALLTREAGRRSPLSDPLPALATEPIHIPVRYGGDAGPDLQDVAAFAGVSESEVIARHAAPTYRVFMMGFVPGFPYMGTVDPSIAMPRRATPRLRVASGSVGIAGPQTGIYPADTPGGWQLIGRTPIRMFDPGRPAAFLLKPGDAIRFFAVP